MGVGAKSEFLSWTGYFPFYTCVPVTPPKHLAGSRLSTHCWLTVRCLHIPLSLGKPLLSPRRPVFQAYGVKAATSPLFLLWPCYWRLLFLFFFFFLRGGGEPLRPSILQLSYFQAPPMLLVKQRPHESLNNAVFLWESLLTAASLVRALVVPGQATCTRLYTQDTALCFTENCPLC